MLKNISSKLQGLFKSPHTDSSTPPDNANTNNNARRDSYSYRPGQEKPLYQRMLNRFELEEIYRANGIGKRVVDILVEDATRGFIDCDADLMQEL